MAPLEGQLESCPPERTIQSPSPAWKSTLQLLSPSRYTGLPLHSTFKRSYRPLYRSRATLEIYDVGGGKPAKLAYNTPTLTACSCRYATQRQSGGHQHAAKPNLHANQQHFHTRQPPRLTHVIGFVPYALVYSPFEPIFNWTTAMQREWVDGAIRAEGVK